MIYKTLHDIPIKVYHRIKETDDLTLLEYDSLPESIANSINQTKPKKADIKELEKIFESMKECQFNKFGVSDQFKDIYILNKDIINLQIKELEGDTSVRTRLKEFDSKLAYLMKQFETDIDLETAHARERRIVEKETGRDIDKICAFDFYVDLKDISDRFKQLELEEQFKKMRHAS